MDIDHDSPAQLKKMIFLTALPNDTRRTKVVDNGNVSSWTGDASAIPRPSYRDMLQGNQGGSSTGSDGLEAEEEEVSDDDIEEEVVDSSMFSTGMTR